MPPAGSAGPQLTVIIPASNERANLELLLPALRQVLLDLGLRAEIFVVTKDTHDGTAEVASRGDAKALVQTERGYGGALLTGFAAAAAPYVLTMDADLSHRPSFIESLWAARNDAEVVIASRYVPGGSAEMGRVRLMMSRILNRTYRRALALGVRDLSSGFRLYRRDIVKGIRVVARDFDFLQEILVRIVTRGWRVREVPFKYMPRGSGSSNVRLLKFGWAFLRTLVRVWRLRNSIESADYDYRAFDSPIWLQRYWQRTRYRIVMSYLETTTSILDIGSGSSRIIVDLPEAVAFDISEMKLRWLRDRHRLLVRGSLERLPFADRTFSAVISSEVIEHVPDVPENFDEVWRVLRPGGVFILGTPDYDRLAWRTLERLYERLIPGGYASEHITHYTRDTLVARVRGLNWEVLDVQYVGFGEMILKLRKPLLPPIVPAHAEPKEGLLDLSSGGGGPASAARADIRVRHGAGEWR